MWYQPATDAMRSIKASIMLFPFFISKAIVAQPNNASEILNVEVYVALMDLGELDVIASTFTIDILLVATWNESVESCNDDLKRLKAVGLYHTKSNYSHALGDVSSLLWTPNLEIMEARKMAMSDEVNPTLAITLDHTGHDDSGCSYKLKLREQGLINCKTDFDDYPFDVQICPMTFRSYMEDDGQLRLFWRPKRGDLADQRANLLRMLEYRIQLSREEFNDVPWSFRSGSATKRDPLVDFRRFSGIRLEIRFNRILTNMFYNAYLPCILLALVGAFSFFMTLESFSERITVTTSILLSFYTIYSSLSNGLPRATLMTYLDQFLLLSMVFMSLVTLQPIAVHCYSCRLRREAELGGAQSPCGGMHASFMGAPLAEADESIVNLSGFHNEKAKEVFSRKLRRQRQLPEVEVISRKVRRLDSLLKYPLIVIMIAYLISHFIGTY